MKKRLIALFISIVMVLSAFPVGAKELEGRSLYMGINDMIEYVVTNYHFGTSDQKLLRAIIEDAAVNNGGTVTFEGAVKTIFRSLDEYSIYYNEEEYQEFMEVTNGSFSGIGIRYMSTGDSLLVVEVFSGSPAEEAGLKKGDLITMVAGESVSAHTQNEILSMVRGETGTTVDITFSRNGSSVTVPVLRAPIEEEEVTWEMLPEGIGYIRISSFNANTDQKLAAAMESVVSAGSMKMIIDLRANGGGLTSSALRALSLIVPKGKTILNVKFKDEEVTYTSENEARQNPYKIAVLVDENTASAAEIFAGAIQDNKVGTLIGARTFGKGTMQQVRPLRTGGGIRLTIGEFFTPGGNVIRDEGILPDISVQNDVFYYQEDALRPLDLFDEAGVGSNSENVYALEERLQVIGYFDGEPDTVYDEETAFSVKELQAVLGLPMTGKADTLTLVGLNNVEYDEIQYEEDLQLRAAVDFLK